MFQETIQEFNHSSEEREQDSKYIKISWTTLPLLSHQASYAKMGVHHHLRPTRRGEKRCLFTPSVLRRSAALCSQDSWRAEQATP
ncbi:predicted protein [Coccidioides posadasii str. Silveira]|uniref:Predicted protein n=1 Tax=Coccidioides posadasii (strain RMSCC 757 / Silveira) TaxID=443226 RepID=E9D4H1_COCPS|nr:predicted protein [Coccidioides posadasii str. Silveira]